MPDWGKIGATVGAKKLPQLLNEKFACYLKMRAKPVS
jgi:hypothetical protein